MTYPDLRYLLKAETASVHDALHRLPAFAALAEGRLSVADHGVLMARMGRFYAALDPVLVGACARLASGTGGYRYRPRAGMFRGSDRDVPGAGGALIERDLDLATPMAFAGAVYVVDGSVLGGRILGAVAPGSAAHPYWRWCASDGAAIWQSARRLLSHVDKAGADRSLALDAAHRVFRIFAVSMQADPAEVAA